MAFYLKAKVKALHLVSPFQFDMVPSSYATIPNEPWWDGSVESHPSFGAVSQQSSGSHDEITQALGHWHSARNETSLRSRNPVWYCEINTKHGQESRGCWIYLSTPREIFAAAKCYRFCPWDMSQLIYISLFRLKMHCRLLNKCVFYDRQANEWNICHFRN